MIDDLELFERQQAMDAEARKRGLAIGRAKAEGPLVPMVYVGDREDLRGRCALVGQNGAAQFTNIDTGLGYGWWPFGLSDFERTAPSKSIPERFRTFVFRKM